MRTHHLLRTTFHFAVLLLFGLATTSARGFVTASSAPPRFARKVAMSALSPAQVAVRDLRGGQADGGGDLGDTSTIKQSSSSAAVHASIVPLALSGASLASLARWYSGWLQRAPIGTKSVTAAFIFGLSDTLAQRLERRGGGSTHNNKASTPPSHNRKRLFTSVAVGFLYYGPVAHYWYEAMFYFLPSTTLFSTLQKAALGQVLFGPCFTCLFFASSLWQSGQLTFPTWIRKIRRDFPSAWVAGLSFWPLIDSISYSCVPKDFIPLFVNVASLVWTVYLSLVANRQQQTTTPPQKQQPPQQRK